MVTFFKKRGSWYMIHHKVCGLGCFDSVYDFPFLSSLSLAFEDYSTTTNYTWYHYHFHGPQFLKLSSKVPVFVYLLVVFNFPFVVRLNHKQNLLDDKFFFFVLINTGSGLIVGIG